MTAGKALGRQWDEYESSELQSGEETLRRQRATGLHGPRGADWDSAPVHELEVRKLKPTQRYLFRNQHDSVRAATVELPPVKVVRAGSTHYVVDGHHRWDIARERGDKTIRAKVVDRKDIR